MVGVQPEDLQTVHQLRKTVDELGIGTVPSVDGLVRVTDGAQVRAVAHQGPNEPKMSRVHVLELVH